MLGFPGGLVVKNSPGSTGNVGSVPGSARSPGEGSENPLQYSCLRNPMNRRGLVGCSLWGHRTGHILATKFSSVQLLSRVQLFSTPGLATKQHNNL